MVLKYDRQVSKYKVNNFCSAILKNGMYVSHYAKIGLNKMSGAMHQTLIFFNIDAQGFRETKNENPPTG